MAETYWISFDLSEDRSPKGNYGERYKALYDAIDGVTTETWWVETTSFLVFKSGMSSSALVALIKGVIDIKIDKVVLGMPGYKTMRAIGALKNFPDLQRLVDFAKKD